MKLRGLSIWGDSIAKGVVFDEQRGRYAVCRDNCVSRLSRDAGVEVENFSVMGNTTEQGLRRMEGQPLKPGNLAVIEFGGNDCDLDWAAACEHPEVEQYGRVPLEAFGENLRAMVRRVRDGGMIPALVTPPPLVAQRYFDWVSRKLDKARILNYLGDVEHIYRWQERYALMIRRVAARENAMLLDVRDWFLSQARFTDLMCVDGIHPNARGHELLFERFSGLLQNA
ncbi:MAG TPA: SGNH/GDSL hydrolase family protein [Candidatus Faecivicinus avistercoris]|nr:SGNH/GDSL hydrolase family protein [Candidatus Faecivicinus avistercoris]